MDEVLHKLSEIETTAHQIMDKAEEKKLALSEEYRKKVQEYNKEMEESSSREIAHIRENLEHNKESQLEALNQKTQRILTSLDQYYEENHQRLSREIFEKIIHM